MATKTRAKGDKYRPVVEVLKLKGDVPTVLLIGGKRFVLDHGNK